MLNHYFYFPIHNFKFNFSISMAGNPVNCAECLTRLTLKNHVRGVQRYLNKMIA